MGSPFSMAILRVIEIPLKSQLLELREDGNLSQNAFAWRCGKSPIWNNTNGQKHLDKWGNPHMKQLIAVF